MGDACPGKCALGLQRPLDALEISVLSNTARAEIALLRGTALLCEMCGCVYLEGRSETALLGKVPAVGQQAMVRKV